MPPFREPDLVAAISRDIALRGLVGEEDAGLLVYLAYSSRKLRQPLSVIIRGPSGSGKDQVQRVPAKLMPRKAVLDMMSISPQGLYYGGKNGWLRNRILLGGERKHEDDDAQRDRTSAIRQMLGNGYITKLTVKDGTGVAIRQDGPVSYSETTTQEVVFNEDSNRCLLVRTNPSDELTSRVLRSAASKYLPESDRDADRWVWLDKTHESFQDWLKPVDVRIPYAQRLADLVPRSIEIRRVFNQVLSVIEVVTYLHQATRKPDADGKTLATLTDYEIARQVVVRSLEESIGAGSDYQAIDAKLDELPQRFTNTQAGAIIGVENRFQTKKWVDRLEDCGMIRFVRKGAHGVKTWEKTGKAVEDAVLPSAAALSEPA